MVILSYVYSNIEQDDHFKKQTAGQVNQAKRTLWKLLAPL